MAGFDGVFAPAPTCSQCNPLIVVVMNFMKHMINPEAVSICHQRNRFLEGFFSLGPNWVGPYAFQYREQFARRRLSTKR